MYWPFHVSLLLGERDTANPCWYKAACTPLFLTAAISKAAACICTLDSAHNAHFVSEAFCMSYWSRFRRRPMAPSVRRQMRNSKITRRTPPCSLYALLIHPRSFPHSIDYPPPRDFQHHLLSLEPYPSKHKVKEQVILLQLFPFFRHSWRLVARPRGKVRKPQHLPLCMHC